MQDENTQNRQKQTLIIYQLMWLFAIWLTVAVFKKVAMSRDICFMSDSQPHVDLN